MCYCTEMYCACGTNSPVAQDQSATTQITNRHGRRAVNSFPLSFLFFLSPRHYDSEFIQRTSPVAQTPHYKQNPRVPFLSAPQKNIFFFFMPCMSIFMPTYIATGKDVIRRLSDLSLNLRLYIAFRTGKSAL